MELLVPGLILVALMVYASTRIKKTAAAAFEPEIVETAHFSFEKPEGLLLIINGDPKFDAEGYSKDFGEGDAASQRQITFAVTRSDGQTADLAEKGIKSNATVVSREIEVIDGTKFVELELLAKKSDETVREFHKLGVASGNVFDLCVTSLEDPSGDAKRKIGTMISSFNLKR